MRFTNSILFVLLGMSTAILPACSSNPPTTATRAATQTPFIVFVPVTTTPEPATITPLPTVTPEVIAKTPTRTATRVVVAARPTATRTVPPTPAGPPPTTAPACAFAAPILLEPNDGAERRTFETRPGSDTFIFKWTPPANVGGDDIAYKIQMDAKKAAGKAAGSDVVYISHSKYVSDSQKQQCGGNQPCFIYDSQRVHNLPQGDETVTVLWSISVVKFKGNIDDLGYLSGTATECTGSRSTTRQINLIVL